ncbi:MAG: hypothetical protein JOZ57_10790 [Abitibacteriaceae bacterium]|nr:hypothetical protein [Abditibacteriaceae bacterium]
MKNKKGELLFYNFRAVEPGVIYRGSGFPRDKVVTEGGKRSLVPAAYQDGQAFNFFRARGIRHIIALREEDDEFHAEQGYFEYWNKYWLQQNQPQATIIVTALPVRSGHAYDLNARKLKDFPPGQPPFALRAAADFIDIMKAHKPADGAIYIHDSAGKDSAGIVAAAYEMWRNQGRVDREKLWQQVMDRYLVSNVLIARDRTATRFAGRKLACQGESEPNWVCKRWLEKLRPELETIAQL